MHLNSKIDMEYGQKDLTKTEIASTWTQWCTVETLSVLRHPVTHVLRHLRILVELSLLNVFRLAENTVSRKSQTAQGENVVYASRCRWKQLKINICFRRNLQQKRKIEFISKLESEKQKLEKLNLSAEN
jgi:hypothetical protein